MTNPKKKRKFLNLFKVFNAKLHGKEVTKRIDTSKMSDEQFGNLVLKELGGIANLVTIDSCITRLRLKVSDLSKINTEQLEFLGCDGVIKVGEDKVQLVFGEKAIVLEKYFHKLKKENNN